MSIFPEGAWEAEPVHSHVSLSATHLLVTRFRADVAEFAATVDTDATPQLSARAAAASLTVRDPQLSAHLRSPEFLDVERFPEITLTADTLDGDRDVVRANAVLTLRGMSVPVGLTGRLRGPVADPFGGERVGLSLSGTTSRSAFGITWNMDLPGGGVMLSDEVMIEAVLELVRVR